MKKFLYGIIALAGLAMVGCSNEYDEQITANTEKVDRVFYGYTESDNAASTRTTLDENGKVVWSGEEHIAINGTEFEVYQPGTEFPSTNVMFSPVGDLAEAEAFNAVYPFEAWAAEGKIDFSHLKEQEAKNATFGHGYAVTVGQADEDGNIYFRNAMSFLRVNFTLAAEAKEDAITIKKIVLTADDNLWGEAEVDYTTGVIGEVVASTESAKTITYLAGEDVVLTKDNSYEAYIALPPHADNSRVFDLYVEGENAWTGTKYTWSREDLTGLKFQRNIITTVNRAITPREVEYVAEGVYKTDEKRFVVENEAGFIWTLNALNEAYSNANHMMRGATIVLNKEDGIFNFKGMTVPVVNATDITIDGNNMTLENVTYDNSTDAGYVAMFNIFTGNIKNLYMDKVTATHLDIKGRASALIGYYRGGELENIQISKANVAGFQKVAGLVSFIDGNVTIVNCSTNNVKLVASKNVLYQAGGLVAYIYAGSVLIKDSAVYGVTLTNTAQMGEDDDDESWYCRFSGGFVGSIEYSTAGAEVRVEFDNCKLSGVTARPALAVSRRGHELFGDRFTYGYENISGYDSKEPSVVIVDGVSLEERQNPWLDALTEAIEAAEDGETVALASNIKLSDYEVIEIAEGKNITLDLNGNTITLAENRTVAGGIVNNGTLNLTNGTIEGLASDANQDVITNNGTMTVKGVTISQAYNAGAAIANTGNLTINSDDENPTALTTIGATVRNEGEDAVLTINGGKFEQVGNYSNDETYKYNVDARGGKVYIYGGEFTSTNGVLNVSGGAEMTIDNGTFKHDGTTNVATRHLAYVQAKLTINGGEFEGIANSSAGGTMFCLNSSSANLVINGGKFASYWSGTMNPNFIIEKYNSSATFDVNDGLFSNNKTAGIVYATNTDAATAEKYPYVAAPVVATIGTAEYYSLNDATKAAQEGETIVVFDGTYNLDELTITNSGITIEGKTKEGVILSLNKSIYLQDKVVNFKNLTYTAPAGLNYTEQAFAFVHHAKEFNFDNCIINRLRMNVSGSTITNSTFEVITNSGFDGYGLFYYGNNKSNVKVENCVFNTTGKAIVVYNEGANEYNLTVNKTIFKSNNTSTDKAAISIHSEYGIYGTLTVNESTATGFATQHNGGLWREVNNNAGTDNNNFMKVIDGVYYIGKDADLNNVLKQNVEEIEVVMTNNLNLNASDAYLKLGGEDTKLITIDGQGKYTFNMATTYWSRVSMVNPEAKLVLKNMDLTSQQASGTWNSYDVTFKCNTELINVNAKKAIALDGDAQGAEFVLNDVTINETHDYYALWIVANGAKVTIDGLDITSAGRGIKIDEQYVGDDNVAKVTLNIANANFKTKNKAAIIVKSKAGAEINWGEGNNITNVAADPVNGVWVDEDAADYADLVVVNGTTCIVEGSRVIATVGGEEYTDVKEALDAAQSGDTVTLAAGTYTFPAADLKEGVILDCEEGTIFSGSSNLNINGATVKGATFKNESGNAAGGTVNGTFEDCVFEGSSNGLRNCYAAEGKVVTFRRCKFVGSVYGVHFDGGKGEELVFEECELTGWNSFGSAIKKVTMTDCKYHKSGYGRLRFYQNATITNGIFDADFDGVDFGDGGSNGGNLSFAAEFTNCEWTNNDFNELLTWANGIVITVNGVKYVSATQDINNIIADAVTNGEEDVQINLPAGEIDLDSQVGSGETAQNKEVTITGAGIDVTTVNGDTNPHGNTGSPGNYAQGLDLVFENLTFVTANNGYQGGFGHAKSVTFKNCKIVGQFYCHSWAPHYFYDCTIDPLTGYLYTYGANVVFERCKFPTSNGKALQVYAESNVKSTVDITDCEFSTSVQATTWDGKPVTPIDINSANGATFVVNITNCKETGFPVGLNSGDSLWNNKCDMSLIDLTIDGFKMITGGIAQYNDSYLATNANGLLKAVKNYDNTTIYLLNTTYEFTSLDIKNKANLTLTNYEGTPVLKGLTYITDSKASFKSLRFSNPNGNKTTPASAGDLVDRHVNGMKPVVGVYVASDVEFNGCMFDMGGNVTYGFSSYASTNSKFDSCYFFCDNKRPIATNGSKTVVTGCAFYSPYHYALRIFENGGSNSYQEVTFTNNKYFNSNDKGEYEGINISRKGGTATILGTFTIGNNKVNGVLSTPETLKFRHHKDVTMSDECVYNCTDGSFTGFESEL